MHEYKTCQIVSQLFSYWGLTLEFSTKITKAWKKFLLTCLQCIILITTVQSCISHHWLFFFEQFRINLSTRKFINWLIVDLLLTKNCTHLKDWCNFVSLWKIYLGLFIPNCTQNCLTTHACKLLLQTFSLGTTLQKLKITGTSNLCRAMFAEFFFFSTKVWKFII